MSVRTRERNRINREQARQASRLFSTPFLSAEAENELVDGGEEAADIRPVVQATEEEVTRDRRAVLLVYSKQNVTTGVAESRQPWGSP